MKKLACAALALACGAAFAQAQIISLNYRSNVYIDNTCYDSGATYPAVQLTGVYYCDQAHGGCSPAVAWQGPNTSAASFQVNSIYIDNPQGYNSYYAGTTCHALATSASPFGEGIDQLTGGNRVLIPTQSGGVDVCTTRDPGRFKIDFVNGVNGKNCFTSGDSCNFNEKSASWEFTNDTVRYYLNSGFVGYKDGFGLNVTNYRGYSDSTGTTAVVTFNYQCTMGGVTTTNSVAMPFAVFN